MREKKQSLHRGFKSQALTDKVFDIVNHLILGIAVLLVLYPMYFVVIASFSDPVAINNGQVRLLPIGFNTLGYQKIFENVKIWRSYSNTIFYTVVGTSINIILTMMLAYPLSRKNFFAKGPLMIFVMFTMYFQGGLIPTYLWVNQLHLYNTPWIMVLLPAINVFNLIIAINFIRNNIPEELYEAASIDGANKWQQFTRISLPLLKPTTVYVLTISIYAGLAMFNESYMLWKGNNSPQNIGLTIVGYLYRQGIEKRAMGYACAVGLVLLVIVMIVNMIQLAATGTFKKEER